VEDKGRKRRRMSGNQIMEYSSRKRGQKK
jgi:hypothetical protein